MCFVCKYEVAQHKISKMIAVRKPGTDKDMVVVQITDKRFITLEVDPLIHELRIVCLHNFENDQRLQATGKINAR